MRHRAIILLAATLALGLSTLNADASCSNRRDTGTAVGAVGGGVAGNLLSHGSAVGTVAGAVVGGVAGREINSDDCRNRHTYHHGRRGYYDRNHRWHYYR